MIKKKKIKKIKGNLYLWGNNEGSLFPNQKEMIEKPIVLYQNIRTATTGRYNYYAFKEGNSSQSSLHKWHKKKKVIKKKKKNLKKKN